MRSYIRQESQFKYHRPDVSQPWSGHTFNSYENCRVDFNRLEDCLSWSGQAHSRYGNCVLKFNRLDAHPPWSGRAKPYMEITCSGCATVWTTVPHSPNSALKQERFLTKIFRNLSHSCPPGRPCPQSGWHPHITLQSPILFLSLYIEVSGH
jgi:hypothetical protein